ncbi:SpoVK/Ycf46/Vps4 family AAA+-type ATPase [Pseudoduganella flava]|uniref:AAA family ATPase n=1 Tax=Pseudoduganella flava TaxID=871742 RepID=A0A562Q0P7_9BURK|nr:ATP-binding protein [Pseudoduganella flava]QGZ38231.1 AAA family ATPase [Pseudoduganella flava]TWI50237.1 SpoVK/Ycf46/Vps4 family AAA+-type ATPase [Pseudoduganella flava]
MNAADWNKENDRYLSEAVAWVRTRLDGMAPPKEEPPPAARPAKAFWRTSPASAPLQVPLQGQAAQPPAAQRVPRPASLDEPAEEDMAPALVQLTTRLDLSPFERDVLLLCAAMEFDTGIAAQCARAQDNANRGYPTFGLALAMFDEPSWDALSPERPLRYWRLVDIRQPQGVPLIAASLSIDERIVNFIKGLNYLDDRLAMLVLPVAGPAEPLPPSQQAVAEAIAHAVAHPVEPVAATPALPLVQLLGPDSASKRAIAGQAARALGCQLYALDPASLPQAVADVENFARLWQRESLLLPLALYVDTDDLDPAGAGEAHRAAINRLLLRTGGVMFLATREPWARLGRAVVSVDAAKPSTAEQQRAWQDVLTQEPERAASDAATLASHFNLNVDDIRRIAAQADGAALAPLWDSALLHARPALDQLAQRIDPVAGWDDLQLPDAETALLRQIAGQVAQRGAVYDEWGFRARMNRGLGISALFAGDSGTGKTMAAEVIARELHLLIYRIDLSAVVSKFIGETEKNLRKLFDGAEDSGAILFFDEADALFGKRSEVKDSHDRYANIEVNYLLQRMEAYRGLAILASNRKGALDTAFLRRLRFIVNFPMPAPSQRERIWRRIFPPETPLEELDWQRLAQFGLSGGSIHNAALNAAFLAARAGRKVDMPLVLEAIRGELRKLEKPVSEADFRQLAPAGARS